MTFSFLCIFPYREENSLGLRKSNGFVTKFPFNVAAFTKLKKDTPIHILIVTRDAQTDAFLPLVSVEYFIALGRTGNFKIAR